MGMWARQGSGLDRRRFLAAAGGVGLGLVAGCGASSSRADLLRAGTGGGTLRAEPLTLDLAGEFVSTWGYNGVVPGPEIRLRQGETVRIRLENRLPDPTTIHWHGLSLPNPMDGVPDVTQSAVARDGSFSYQFVVPDAGSFMYHSHFGHQLDRGLYGPLIVEPRTETLAYDREYTLMLDDWRDGMGSSVGQDSHRSDGGIDRGDTAAAEVEPNGGPKMGGRNYPLVLVNGRPPRDPQAFEVRRGERVRLRVMNIAADTGFRFAVEGHGLTVTHTDGMPVEPVVVDALRLGMGERYDVIVEAGNPGAWQIAVVPEAKRGFGRAVLRYADSGRSDTPPADARPAELGGRLATYADLGYAGERTFPERAPDRVHDLTLTGSEINGQNFPDAEPLPVAAGEWVRVTMRNDSSMWHPMHLHGHHFRVLTADGNGPLKDTMMVPSGETTAFDFLSNNPGEWMFHCHNHYHMDNGMARIVSYRG
jgi:FtsP/CotA-like multicopper oxidase with cupredoxin domain